MVFWQVDLDKLASPTHEVQENAKASAIVNTSTILTLGLEDVVDDYFSGIADAKCGQDSTLYVGASRPTSIGNHLIRHLAVPCVTVSTTTPTLAFGGRCLLKHGTSVRSRKGSQVASLAWIYPEASFSR